MHFGSLTRRARFEPGTLLRAEAAWRVTANGRFPARRSEPGVPAVDPLLPSAIVSFPEGSWDQRDAWEPSS